jgi:hypothetical protein
VFKQSYTHHLALPIVQVQVQNTHYYIIIFTTLLKRMEGHHLHPTSQKQKHCIPYIHTTKNGTTCYKMPISIHLALPIVQVQVQNTHHYIIIFTTL